MPTNINKRALGKALETTKSFHAFLVCELSGPQEHQLEQVKHMLELEKSSDRPRRSVLKRLHSLQTELRRGIEWQAIEEVL